MKIALVQFQPKAGDPAYNAERHRYWIRQAHTQGAGVVIFSELSLTSYEPDLAADLSVEANDKLWQSWQALSNELQLSFGLGMPIRTKQGIVIGLVLFQPDKPHRIYAKQFLHADEEPFFVPGTDWDGYWAVHQIALAICYELSVEAHVEQVLCHPAQMYLASVAKFENGIAPAYQRLAELARSYQIPTMMVNAVGPADGGLCTGQSAVWNAEGNMIGQLAADEEACLLFDSQTNEVLILRS